MEKITRRQFLFSLLAAGSMLALGNSTQFGALAPALAAVNEAQLGKFSGDIFFKQMHAELLRKKPEDKPRQYPSQASDEKIDILIVGGGIAGLDTAYYLLTHPQIQGRGVKVRLFELNDEVGGTAKEYQWQGIPYSNSAAYFYLFEPQDPIMKLYRDLGVLDEVVVPSGRAKDSAFVKDHLYPDIFRLGRGQGFESETRALEQAQERFLAIDHEMYPEVPFDPAGPFSRAEFQRLDRLTLGALLEQGGVVKEGRPEYDIPANLPLIMREYAENYCYSSFGCSSYEVSAWQGINWFASEFEEGGVGVLPGGNGRMAALLKQKIDALDPDCILTDMPVVDVSQDAAGGHKRVTVALDRDPNSNRYRTFKAGYVVMACPLMVSQRLLAAEFPQDIRHRMDVFDYCPYIVANVMVEGDFAGDAWDIYCLDGFSSFGKAGEKLYRDKPFMDIINATWVWNQSGRRAAAGAQGAKAEAGAAGSVFTVYAPQPFPGQRRNLLSDDFCQGMKEKVRRGLLYRLGPLGLDAKRIVDIRIARWGHSMFKAFPGILSSGILDDLQAAVADKGIYFAGTDLLGAPTVENCHITARAAAEKLAGALKKE